MKKILFIAFLGLFAIAGGGGYIYWKKQNQSNSTENSKLQSTEDLKQLRKDIAALLDVWKKIIALKDEKIKVSLLTVSESDLYELKSTNHAKHSIITEAQEKTGDILNTASGCLKHCSMNLYPAWKITAAHFINQHLELDQNSKAEKDYVKDIKQFWDQKVPDFYVDKFIFFKTKKTFDQLSVHDKIDGKCIVPLADIYQIL